MKILRNTCFLFILASSLNNMQASALQVVYPKTTTAEINASSTMFIGNVAPTSELKINDKLVKVYENGSFVEVVPLQDGENTIKIEEKTSNKNESLTYIIKKLPQTNETIHEIKTELFQENEYIYATITKDNTPLRADANEDATRITHLNKDTVITIIGRKGDYYLVSLSPSKTAWIKSNNIVIYKEILGNINANVEDISSSEDSNYDYIKTSLNIQVPYKVSETDNGLMLEIYNAKGDTVDNKVLQTSQNIKNITTNYTATENTLTYFIEMNKNLCGYDISYEGKSLVLKIKKQPQIDKESPLKNITIAIDAGHGGWDSGSIGPTGVKEKDINLDIAKKLKKSLEEAGAKVVMTREEDKDVDLYERIQIAKDKNALLLISLHANALPDGANPYTKHGTSVFYYNKESMQLAKNIRDQLTNDLGTKDDGVCHRSFALTRPTNPISVLVEIAYMIHPTEYSLLLDEKFREKAAQSLKKSIENYILQSFNN